MHGNRRARSPNMDDRIRIGVDDARGRGVFAKAAIAPGTLVVRALPFALVPNDSCMLTHCCVCLACVADPVPCPRCASAVHCSRCADSAALLHEDECAALCRLAAADDKLRSTRSLRLLIRCLCARWRASCVAGDDANADWWGEGDVVADEVEDIDVLVGPPEGEDDRLAPGDGSDDEDEQRSGVMSVDLLEMAKQARYYADSEMRIGHEACAALMGQLCCNSLTIYGRGPGETSREVGVALSASVAMFNHDCSANNADWALDEDGCLVVRTSASVRPGQELCLSYVDTRLPAATRQRRLRRHFFFDCQCVACSAGTSRWTCALCATHNGPFDADCAGCRGARFDAPVQKRKRASRQ